MNKSKYDIFEEAKRLYALGFAILWLRPKSKMPVESGWTTGPRKSWDYLRQTYRTGFNVGVRLGTPSKIGKGYLAVIDVDVKDEEHESFAVAEAYELFKGHNCPMVLSGRGNGSRHYYCLTEKPFKMVTVTKNDKYEICIYSDGRQVVLPPSVHPDTGRLYKWKFGLRDVSELPLVRFKAVKIEKPVKGEKPVKTVMEDFKVEPVKLENVDISDEVYNGIVYGDGITDRSAFLPRAYRALRSAKLSKDEAITVLTDSKLFLGKVGYDHARTNSRNRAAQWILKYTGQRVDAESSPEIFKVAPLPPLPKERDWTLDLVKNSKGNGLKPCFTNAFLILENEFGTSIFHKDDFSLRRTYGVNTPWGGIKGHELNDEDITAMRRYICEKYFFELEEKHIVSAITSISSRNHHHPVREYLDRLEWDGVPRLNTWLKDYAGVEADSEYLETISRKVICAMVTRAYHPGAKFDYVLILEGPNQGEGKSRSIRALAGPEWAGTVRFDMDHKDFVLALQGRWVTEISELSGLGRKNTAFVKAIVSEESDRIRHPYGRFTETLPRQGIFIGTTNHFQYLEDETGNRRFWPVRVGPKINVEGIKKIRNQLFAEAKVYCEKGEALYIENTKIELIARNIQSTRASEDSWEEKIRIGLKEEKKKPKKERLFSIYQFKILDLFKYGPLRENPDSEVNLRRACRALRRLGFYPKDIKGKKGHGKYWIREKSEARPSCVGRG